VLPGVQDYPSMVTVGGSDRRLQLPGSRGHGVAQTKRVAWRTKAGVGRVGSSAPAGTSTARDRIHRTSPVADLLADFERWADLTDRLAEPAGAQLVTSARPRNASWAGATRRQ
jgi:hypothetical protein